MSEPEKREQVAPCLMGPRTKQELIRLQLWSLFSTNYATLPSCNTLWYLPGCLLALMFLNGLLLSDELQVAPRLREGPAKAPGSGSDGAMSNHEGCMICFIKPPRSLRNHRGFPKASRTLHDAVAAHHDHGCFAEPSWTLHGAFMEPSSIQLAPCAPGTTAAS